MLVSLTIICPQTGEVEEVDLPEKDREERCQSRVRPATVPGMRRPRFKSPLFHFLDV